MLKGFSQKAMANKGVKVTFSRKVKEKEGKTGRRGKEWSHGAHAGAEREGPKKIFFKKKKSKGFRGCCYSANEGIIDTGKIFREREREKYFLRYRQKISVESEGNLCVVASISL